MLRLGAASRGRGLRTAVAGSVFALVAAVVLGAVVGCLAPAGYRCESNPQCDLDGKEGSCQPTGYCAYADDACPSGLRYETNADADLGDRCVPGGLDGETTDGTGESEMGAPMGGSTAAEGADALPPDGRSAGG